MKKSYWLLVLLHLVIFNLIYVYRAPPAQFFEQELKFQQGESLVSPLNYLQLFFSQIHDEAYYYEWSTIVLGKSFEASYPFEKRQGSPVVENFSEDPKPRLPYLEISFEYPPLMMAPLLGARALSKNFQQFARWLALWISLAYMGCLYLAIKILKSGSKNQGLGINGMLTYSLLAILALGQMWVTRLDVFASLIVMAAVYTLLKERYHWASFFMALGFFIKGFPIILFPLVLIPLFFQRRWRTFVLSALTFFLTLAIPFGALMLGSDGAYGEAFRFHAQRPIHLESFFGWLAYGGKVLWGYPLSIVENFASVNLDFPHSHGFLQVSQWLPWLLFGGVYGIYAWKERGHLEHREDNILFASAMLLLTFILSFKVFSPQFLIWLVPLIFLIRPFRPHGFFLTWLLVMLLSQMIFPHFYSQLEALNGVGFLLLTARNLGLACLVIWTGISWWKMSPS